MLLPTIQGVIDRRILINYRVDPAVLARLLPAPFRPLQIDGRGVAGICLIRLRALRPRFVPAWLGLTSENAAHRIAVEWDAAGRRQTGVYIPRRDSASRFNTLVGGRLFPGFHAHARFRVREGGGRYQVALRSDDGATRVAIAAHRAAALPPGSVFGSVAAASAFFERGSVGYSPGDQPDALQGLELVTRQWRVTPLAVEHVVSSFFDDPARFPPGTATLDCALLMREIVHEWHVRGVLTAAAETPRAAPAPAG